MGGIAEVLAWTVGVTADRYLLALGLTLAVEVPIYTLLLRRLVGATLASAVLAGVVVNLVSHPLGFLVATPVLRPAIGTLPTLCIVEVGAWVGEALLLWARWRRPFPVLLGISYVANAASFSVGLLLFR